MLLRKKSLKAALVGAAIALASGSAGAVDWIMASGYPASNFHTQNIQKFISEVKATTSVNINLNPRIKAHYEFLYDRYHNPLN